ncbi:MAG: hypothetical protein ACXVZU_03330 [Methanobacteriaceae archaeon]
MKVETGDIFIRHKGGKIYRVKSIDNKMVTLESCDDKTQLILTDIFSLEKGYTKKESTLVERDIQKFWKFEIEWISVPEIGPCGHGVAFYYRDDNRGKLDYKQLQIGFIEGYEWKQNKGGRVKVYILARDSNVWRAILCDSEKILKDLKESVRLALQGEVNDFHYAKENIFVVWNV